MLLASKRNALLQNGTAVRAEMVGVNGEIKGARMSGHCLPKSVLAASLPRCHDRPILVKVDSYPMPQAIDEVDSLLVDSDSAGRSFRQREGHRRRAVSHGVNERYLVAARLGLERFGELSESQRVFPSRLGRSRLAPKVGRAWFRSWRRHVHDRLRLVPPGDPQIHKRRPDADARTAWPADNHAHKRRPHNHLAKARSSPSENNGQRHEPHANEAKHDVLLSCRQTSALLFWLTIPSQQCSVQVLFQI